MLNTQKLLYIFPDVAYVAELLPGKKPSTFSIQAFRQVNGEFISHNQLIGESVLKLFNKLDPEEYQVLLPDFLFTNTIVNVKEKTDSKIKQYLTDSLLPELGLNTDEFQIDTTILTEHGDETKVQLSALEKLILRPIQISARETNVTISRISPLSWSLKSLVSLEPSVSVAQVGSLLYVAFHYIGVDQTTQFSIDEIKSVSENIASLKGAEPSIQTVYLISNDLIEEQLKDTLSELLPIQQLAESQDESDKIPSFTKKIIEAGMRTLSIEDYPVPKFKLGKAPAGAQIAITKPEPISEQEADLPEPNSSLPEPDSSLPKPNEKPEPNTTVTNTSKIDGEDLIDTTDISPSVETDDLSDLTVKTKQAENEAKSTESSTVQVDQLPAVTPVPTPAISSSRPSPHVTQPTRSAAEEQDEDDEIEALLTSLKGDGDTFQHSNVNPTKHGATTPPSNKKEQPTASSPTSNSNTVSKKQVIKNKNRTKTMLKMVFVTLAVFFATVGIGIGIGFGVLQLSQSTETTEIPIVENEASPIPLPSPSPSPSPEPELNTEELSILVVNATTKAGYAGDTASQVQTAGFGTVDSSNAKGDYEEGNYVLMSENNQELITALEDATQLELTYQNDATTEDPNNEYDAVVVLAE